MPIECERKYIGINFADVRTALKNVGAVCEGAHLESNSLWDTADRALRPKGTLLRLRTQQWFGPCHEAGVLDGQKHILTLKMVATEEQGCKIREEREVSFDDASTMEGILAGLGYHVTARYEKVREVWQSHNTELALDILPFGEFMEVEGTVSDIEQVATLVGIAGAQQSTASYHRLHQDWRVANNLPPAVNFVFEPSKRAALIRYLQEHTL